MKREVIFKLNIGDIVKDEKRDLTIIDKEIRVKVSREGWNINQKWYKYKCNKCGNEDWIVEKNLVYKNKRGCNTCCTSPKKVVLGINTIYDKAPWMIDLGVSEEDAKKYAPNKDTKIEVICPNCRKTKQITPNKIFTRKTIACSCNDGISYPEKIIYSLLKQLSIGFDKEYSPNWIGKKRYDFYIPSKSMIIEVHGEQHYEESRRKGSRTLKEEQDNDNIKKELAKENGIDNYIVIDARKSELDWIKNSIIHSELNNLFDLSKIDWNKCEEFSMKNIYKEICDYWNYQKINGTENITTGKLKSIFDCGYGLIHTALKRGTKLGWCEYDSKEEAYKAHVLASKIASKNRSKPVEIFKDDLSLGIFSNCVELERQSEELFGVKLDKGKISLVCLGKRNHHKDYVFKYI